MDVLHGKRQQVTEWQRCELNMPKGWQEQGRDVVAYVCGTIIATARNATKWKMNAKIYMKWRC